MSSVTFFNWFVRSWISFHNTWSSFLSFSVSIIVEKKFKHLVQISSEAWSDRERVWPVRSQYQCSIFESVEETSGITTETIILLISSIFTWCCLFLKVRLENFLELWLKELTHDCNVKNQTKSRSTCGLVSCQPIVSFVTWCLWKSAWLYECTKYMNEGKLTLVYD